MNFFANFRKGKPASDPDRHLSGGVKGEDGMNFHHSILSYTKASTEAGRFFITTVTKPLHNQKRFTPQDWKLMEIDYKDSKDSDFITVPWDFFKSQPELLAYISRDTRPTTFAEFKAFIILQWKFNYVKNTTDSEEDEMDTYTSTISDFKEMGLPKGVTTTKYIVEMQYALRDDKRYSQFVRLPRDAFDKSRGKLGMFVEAVINTYHVDTFGMLWQITWNKLGRDTFNIDNLRRYWNTVVVKRREEQVKRMGRELMVIVATPRQ